MKCQSDRAFSIIKPHLPLIFVLLITFLAYSNIFSNQFIGDDIDFFIDWPTTQSYSDITSLFQGANPPQHIGTYRPLRNFSMLFSAHIFSDFMPAYHLVSLSAHLTITFVVYLLVHKISNLKSLSLSTTLLFGLHPIHTEAITFITASYDTIGILLALISFYLFIHSSDLAIARSPDKLSTVGTTKPSRRPKIATLTKLARNDTYRLISCFFLTISFLFNETTLIFPLLMTLHTYLFVPKSNIKKTYRSTLPYIIVAGSFYLFRSNILNIPTRGTYQANNFFLSLLVSLKAVVEYLKTFIWPVNLSISHTLPGNIVSYTYQKYNLSAVHSQSLSDPSTIFSLCLVIGLLVIGYYFRKTHPLISFSLGWILISLLPVINLLPTALVFSERYAYLSSIGFCLLTTQLIFLILKLPKRSTINPGIVKVLINSIIIASISAFYFFHTYNRNYDWHDEITFWSSEVKKNSTNPLVHFLLAKVHQKNMHLSQAIVSYQTAINLAPDLTDAHYHLATIYEYQGNTSAAINSYQQTLNSNPDHQQAYINLHRLCQWSPSQCK